MSLNISLFEQAKVAAMAEHHMEGMKTFTDLVEAATQSAKQAIQTRQAQRKAIQAEQQAREREIKRQEKEKQAAEKRAAEKAVKEAEKARKKEAEKARKEAERLAKENQAPADHRRRGRGTDELDEETDISVLTTRFTNCDVNVVETMDEFVTLIPEGLPVIWRARRMPSKKVLEAADPDADKKQISAGVTLLKAEFKRQLSEFAQTTEREPLLIKRPFDVPEQVQDLTSQLRMDSVLMKMLEERAANETIEMPHPCTVMEAELLQTLLEKKKVELDSMDPTTAESRASEIYAWNSLHMVGFQHGKTFSGTCQGLWPFFTYQLEGTRAIAFVSIGDVSCSTLLELL